MLALVEKGTQLESANSSPLCVGAALPQRTGQTRVRKFAPGLDPDHRDGHVQRIKRHKPDGVYGVDPADAVRSSELPQKTRPIDDGPNITTAQFRQIPDRARRQRYRRASLADQFG